MTPLASSVIAGQGDPVLLIHGSMNSKSNWQALTDVLQDQFTVIATDLTGYGDTPLPWDPQAHTLLDEVQIIRHTLSAAKLLNAPLHIVAHSYGGAVALCYACHHPDEIQSLVLIEPMAMHLLPEFGLARISLEARRLIDGIAENVAQQNPRAGAQAFMDYFAGRGTFSSLTEKAQRNLSSYVKKMLVEYKTSTDVNLSMADYQCIAKPICLITGRSSSHIPLAISRLLIDNHPAIRWIEVPGNHMALYTNPNLVNSTIATWLQHHKFNRQRQRPVNSDHISATLQ